jgi:DNA-binding Xre family transcriptional regulator
LKKELNFSLNVPKQSKAEFPQKGINESVTSKTENLASGNKQKAKSITMYSKEMSRNELAKKLGISFLQLQSAKDEIGQIWTSEKLDFNKAKEICSKFDCEIIDKSPKDNF